MKKNKTSFIESWRFLILLFSVMSFMVACSTVPVTGRRQLRFIPNGQMLQLSSNSYQQFINENRVMASSTSQVRRIRHIGGRIQTSVEEYMKERGLQDRISDFAWEFNVVEDPTVNAWCMPGGKVVFYTGILPVCQTDEGVAVVMGHEIAHAVAEHGNERMSQQVAAQGLMMAGSIALALEDNPKMTHQLLLQSFGIGTQLGLLAFSRKHEAEADHMGLVFMAKAGYDPREAVRFWDRMQKNSGGNAPPEFMSTHPSHGTRISNMERLMPEALEIYNKAKERF